METILLLLIMSSTLTFSTRRPVMAHGLSFIHSRGSHFARFKQQQQLHRIIPDEPDTTAVPIPKAAVPMIHPVSEFRFRAFSSSKDRFRLFSSSTDRHEISKESNTKVDESPEAKEKHAKSKRQQQHHKNTRPTPNSSSFGLSPQVQLKMLHEQLANLHLNATHFINTSEQSMLHPERSHQDVHTYGSAAINTYKSYVKRVMRKSHTSQQQENDLQEAKLDETTTLASTEETTMYRYYLADAMRTARQIEFLLKRHASHYTDWIRHTDPTTPDSLPTPTTTTTNTNTDTSHIDKNDPNQQKEPFPLVLLLDNLRSAHNVGSLLRTADACHCAGVITTGITPNPTSNAKVAKAALGAEVFVATSHFAHVKDALDMLRGLKKKNGKNGEVPGFLEGVEEIFLVALETTDRSVGYTKVSYPPNTKNKKKTVVVLVLGNEVTGVDATHVLPHVDKIVEIPTFGKKNSLNVASCAPVVMYHVLHQWGVMEEQDE